jgi:hypothetical protein
LGGLKWIEVVLLTPATVLLTPVMLTGVLMAFTVMLLSLLNRSPTPPGRTSDTRAVAGLLPLLLSGLAGLAGTWIAVLCDASRVKKNPVLRAGLQASIAAGIGAGTYWVSWMRAARHLGGELGSLAWTIVIVAPIVVGIRELLLLTMRKPPERPNPTSQSSTSQSDC